MGTYNLSYYEILIHYALMMVVVIAGGVMHSMPIMLLGLPLFLFGILGYNPIYHAFGINHANKEGDLDEHE